METKHPVAYISGSKVVVNAYISTNCPNDILIRAMVDLGNGQTMKFPCKTPEREGNGQGADLLYRGTSDIAFRQNQIRHFSSFDITWQWASVDKEAAKPCVNASWTTFGVSSNIMYVTLRNFDLTNETVEPRYFHTLLDFTCKAANLIQSDGLAIAGIWDKINDKTITTADGIYNLTYYANWDCENTNTQSLLLNKDGQCGAFMRFYVDCLKVQGILHSTYNKDHIIVRPSGQGSSPPSINFFFVNNWKFTEGNLSNTMNGNVWEVDNRLIYVGIPEQSNPSGLRDGWLESWKKDDKYNWIYSDFEDLDGVDGQGINSQPESIFANHRFNKIANVYQDPSYGIQYKSEEDFEEKAIVASAYHRQFTLNEYNFDINGDGNPDDLNGDGKIEHFARVYMFFATTNLDLGIMNFIERNH